MNTKRFLLAMGAFLMLAMPSWAKGWDVTGDGVVTAADVTAVYDKLLNNANTYSESAYDVNGDGTVTAADITALYDVMLNGEPSNTTEYTVNGVTFAMVNVEGGTFTMGANAGDTNASDNENPAHQVTVGAFAMGQTEVTQALWQAVMGTNPSHFVDANKPVEKVSWDDCQEFIAKLNEMTGKNFRLPTEAEWEFAARGGNKSNNYLYAGSNDIAQVAWYDDNSGDISQIVATKAANELGLFDMTGNVWEWCSDWFGDYSADAQTNPAGPATGEEKVLRGGSWCSSAKKCRNSKRFGAAPDFADDDMGLRLAM